MLEEMYELDEQELILSQNPTGQENLVKEKRRKLKDMFEKVLLFYQRDSKEKYEEIKKWQREYDIKKRNLQKTLMEKNRQKVANLFVDDPLKHILPNIPLPGEAVKRPEILVERVERCQTMELKHIPFLPGHIFPPGPPPCVPPIGAIPIPQDLLQQMTQTFEQTHASFNVPFYDFYDPLPPPPPPPKSHLVVAHPEPSYVSSFVPIADGGAAVTETIGQELNTPAVISADPQLRDLQAEVTKLVPLSVLRKREKASKPQPEQENNDQSDETYSAFISTLKSS